MIQQVQRPGESEADTIERLLEQCRRRTHGDSCYAVGPRAMAVASTLWTEVEWALQQGIRGTGPGGPFWTAAFQLQGAAMMAAGDERTFLSWAAEAARYLDTRQER